MRLTVPLLGEPELDAVRMVLESGFLTQGPKAAEFETAVRDVTGSAHAFATSSCTTALHLALVAMGVAPGDEVVVPDFTFPATANVVIQQQALPVVVDIDAQTFAMRPDSLEAAITERTRAIIPVHPFGLSAPMGPILEIAGRYGIPVLEDAACALGGTYEGRPLGSLGAAGCLSFHPRKIVTTGEGGMITTDDADLAARIAVLRSHGAVRGGNGMLAFEEAGFNYRLSDVNAAIGVVQMTRLAEILRARRENAATLTRFLEGVPGLVPPSEPAYADHTYQSYVVLLDPGVDRDRVVADMRERGIETTLGTYSLQAEPAYRRLPSAMRHEAPVSAEVVRRALTLPLHPRQTEEELQLVAEHLASVLADLHT